MLGLVQPRQVVRILHVNRLLKDEQQTFSKCHAVRVVSVCFWSESPKLLRNVGDWAMTFLIIGNMVSTTLGEGGPVEDRLLELFGFLVKTIRNFMSRELTSSPAAGSYFENLLVK